MIIPWLYHVPLYVPLFFGGGGVSAMPNFRAFSSSHPLRLVQSMLGAFLTASDAFDSMDQEMTRGRCGYAYICLVPGEKDGMKFDDNDDNDDNNNHH